MSLPIPLPDEAWTHAFVARLRSRNRFYQRKLQAWPRDGARWRNLPFTTKEELLEDQSQAPPFGTLHSLPITQYVRMHQTSGSRGQPLRWLDTRESWLWMLHCWRIIFDMAGVTHRDRLFFPFSFGPFLGFWTAFEGAQQQGWFCVPGGGMTSVARWRMLLDLQMTVVCCTPTYAWRLLETARTEGIDRSQGQVRALILAGEPGASIPSMRRRLEEGWGARVFDHYGMTEIGPLGMECQANPGGFHLLGSECIVEVIDPATLEPAASGQEGELIITNLGRWGSPLLRYRTGDRVVLDPEPCPCGRRWPRVRGGILGRTDDLVLIRGNNVYPSMIEAIVQQFPAIDDYRVIVTEAAGMTDLAIEMETRAAGDVERELAEAVRHAYHFRPRVTRVAQGTLPKSEMKSQRWIRRIADS